MTDLAILALVLYVVIPCAGWWALTIAELLAWRKERREHREILANVEQFNADSVVANYKAMVERRGNAEIVYLTPRGPRRA